MTAHCSLYGSSASRTALSEEYWGQGRGMGARREARGRQQYSPGIRAGQSDQLKCRKTGGEGPMRMENRAKMPSNTDPGTETMAPDISKKTN